MKINLILAHKITEQPEPNTVHFLCRYLVFIPFNWGNHINAKRIQKINLSRKGIKY